MKIGPTTANGLLALQSANGVETMRLDASNRVGIGTTGPDFKLEIVADDTGGVMAVETLLTQEIHSVQKMLLGKNIQHWKRCKWSWPRFSKRSGWNYNLSNRWKW